MDGAYNFSVRVVCRPVDLHTCGFPGDAASRFAWLNGRVGPTHYVTSPHHLIPIATAVGLVLLASVLLQHALGRTSSRGRA